MKVVSLQLSLLCHPNLVCCCFSFDIPACSFILKIKLMFFIICLPAIEVILRYYITYNLFFSLLLVKSTPELFVVLFNGCLNDSSLWNCVREDILWDLVNEGKGVCEMIIINNQMYKFLIAYFSV